MRIGRLDRQFFERLFAALMPLLAVLVAFLIGAIILLLQGVNPIEAYQAMIVGAFGSKNGLADTLVKAIPLMLVGLGIAIAFRGGVINIGAEGQIIVGALFSAFIGIQIGEQIPGFLGILLGILGGTLAGGLWGAIPGFLKARLQVNEILSTVMMNQIAIQIGFFLLRGPMIDPAEVEAGTNIPHSARLPRTVDMPRFTDMAESIGLTQSAEEAGISGYLGELYAVLVEPSRLHSGLIVAIVMAILIYIFLWRTTIGYRIRAVGLNTAASRYAGMQVQRTVVLSMTLSGMMAGMAGAVEILGLHHRMFEPLAVSAGYGFSGIVAALFGKLHPLGIIPASIFFGGLLVGGDKMQRATQVPQVLITAILGLVVLLVITTDYFVKKRANRRVRVETDDTPPDEATAVSTPEASA
ncbi:ABC transporter permease [Candidatus Leptofilum sp.]|uniref:ABC transporter permease n=1 Tax=Candidatus Leptofilum sp. TaxID=3241576 RepID=UPI003B5B129E